MVTYDKENPMTTTLLDFEEYALKRGRQEGRLEGRQEAILDLLELRFGRISEDLRNAIREVTGDGRLARLLKVAATCEDIEVLSAEI